jgi:hypothetical protein
MSDRSAICFVNWFRSYLKWLSAEPSSGLSHPPAHISNLHLRLEGFHKGNLPSANHRRAEQGVGKNEVKKLPEVPAGAGRAEWKILYKMLMAGLSKNRTGQKLLLVVASKVGHFDSSTGRETG